MIKSTALLVLGLVNAVPVAAQLTGTTTRAGCISLAEGARPVTATGMLALHVFPGSPGFKSVTAGDAAERTLILTLPRAACIDDDGGFADPKQRFTTVQIDGGDALERRLRRMVGRRISVTGEGMPANTGHHHAPLILTVHRVDPR